MRQPVRAIGVALVLPASLAVTSCTKDAVRGAPAPPGVAAQRERGNDWKIHGADFNGDGLGDVLWFSTAENRFAVLLMDGTRPRAQGPEIPGPGEGWAFADVNDFNRDGMSDLIWSNAAKGRLTVWLMNGTALLEKGPEIDGPPGGGWDVPAEGEFNRDGLRDALWYNATTNRFAVWLMHGTDLLAKGPEIQGPPGDGWSIFTAADYNADGMSDILWQNTTTNRFAVWLMSGVEVLAKGAEIQGPGDGWHLGTGGDFNRDGMSDLGWLNAGAGRFSVWLMNGTHLLAKGPEIQGPGVGWTLANGADMNRDGMSDALWVKVGSSRMAVWLMNGTRMLGPGPEIQGPGAPGDAGD